MTQTDIEKRAEELADAHERGLGSQPDSSFDFIYNEAARDTFRYVIVAALTIEAECLPYLKHREGCNWEYGSCDCGLSGVLQKLQERLGARPSDQAAPGSLALGSPSEELDPTHPSRELQELREENQRLKDLVVSLSAQRNG